jgi:hypothetical protein
VRNKINSYINTEWTNRWKGLSEARQTKIFFPTPNAKLTQKLLNYDKTNCAKLFRWITGHSFHRYHNHLLQPEIFTCPKCRACQNSNEETSHLYAFCHGLAHIRIKTLGSVQLNENFEWKPQQLLAMINEIDKLYPEEGKPDDPINIPDPQTHDTNPVTDHE